MNKTQKITLSVELTYKIIEEFGKKPGDIFCGAFTPYDAVADVYPEFFNLKFSERVELVLLIWDYMLNSIVNTYESCNYVEADYWYYVVNQQGIIVEADTHSNCYEFDVDELVAANVITNEFDVVRLKYHLVTKGVLKKEHTLLNGKNH